ncbi:oxidoreductase [Paludisphaera mucosa]|uniref:Oxidoreductase n=1 Tax=Paludisphaera mucosa TaxID=3030827 RepID=A0ABT6FJU1_9BACT|nr:oxidoreductase [Paludisphaera mucosa]MDG3007848.1 oxidoreductase [Paludisphaera mucosa]
MTSEQKPIGSGFGATTTAEEALGGRDLSGKVAVVTGGYSGIGVETTRVLSEAGATVVVPARTPDKARANVGRMPRVELAALDLADPGSIDAFARDFLASGRPIHFLINSAGVMACPLTRDARGNELQFSANHLGHFQLTARLWPALVKAGGARVVALTSRGHRFAGVDFDDPNFERRPYDKWQAYGQSKSANALFALGLDRRGEPHGVRAFSVHPGGILTDLARHLTDEDLARYGLSRLPDGRIDVGRTTEPLKTVPQGAATSIWCATSPRLDGEGGVYCEDCDVSEATPGDMALRTGVAPWACDPELAERLWTLSEAFTGVRF